MPIEPIAHISNEKLPWTVHPHLLRVGRILFFSFLFVVAGIFLILAPPLRPSPIREVTQTIVGIVGLAFGTLGIAIPIYSSIIRCKPVVTLSAQGIIFPNGTLIHWHEIQKVEPYTLFGNHNLTISLTENSPLFARRPYVDLSFAFASMADYQKAVRLIDFKLTTR